MNFSPHPKPLPKNTVKPVKIKKVSNKTKKNLSKYGKAREEYLLDHHVCEVCKERRATEIHHKKGRGKYLSDKTYFLAVDRMCHQKVEMNPEWAKEMGFSLSRLEVNDMENYLHI